MQYTIFYSWQSDLANKTNRGFIETALKKAAKAIIGDDSVDVEPVIDRDTQGTTGSPDIASTIFQKIEQSDIFVCDVSIINASEDSQRPTPNPNVLIELGFAIKALGWERILMVCNTNYGALENLPFDLRMRRTVPYEMSPENSYRADERNRLAQTLEAGIREITKLSNKDEVQATPAGLLIEAIENSKPTQKTLAGLYMSDVIARLEAIDPKLEQSEAESVHWDDVFVHALEKSLSISSEFSQLTGHSASWKSKDSIQVFYEYMGKIAAHYAPSRDVSYFSKTDFDFYRFMGHELLVILVAHLLNTEDWLTIADLLSQEIYVSNIQGGISGTKHFTYLAQYVTTLDIRRDRLKKKNALLHGDILSQRYPSVQSNTPEELTFNSFVGADLLLFLRSHADIQNKTSRDYWFPWTALYIDSTLLPSFVIKSSGLRYAQNLVSCFALKDVDELRSVFKTGTGKLGSMFGNRVNFYRPFEYFDFDSIGSKS